MKIKRRAALPVIALVLTAGLIGTAGAAYAEEPGATPDETAVAQEQPVEAAQVEEEEPVSFTIDVGECPGAGSPTVPVTVTIDPPGGATIDITGPGGPYLVDDDGAVLDLPAGAFHADADPTEGFFMEDDSVDFSVESCPEVLASVIVKLNACPVTSSTTKPATVTINPAGGAQVAISGPNGFNKVVSGSGATLGLAPGVYTWTADESPGFELLAPFEGVLNVGSCVVEVLGEELPKTGANLPALAGIGFAFLLLGAGMVALSRRPAFDPAGILSRPAVLRRMSGRSDWASFFAASSLLGTVLLRFRRRVRGTRRLRHEGRASRHR